MPSMVSIDLSSFTDEIGVFIPAGKFDRASTAIVRHVYLGRWARPILESYTGDDRLDNLVDGVSKLIAVVRLLDEMARQLIEMAGELPAVADSNPLE